MSDIEDKEFVRLLVKSIDAFNWCLKEAKDMGLYVVIHIDRTDEGFYYLGDSCLRDGVKLHLQNVVRNTRKVLFAPKNESTEP